jgi:RNA polymerase sigma-70 factor (ECF subfamily)
MAIAATLLGREALAHVDALYNHARRLTGNLNDADELVQETYIRAMTSAHTFVGGNLKAWLFTILRNLYIDIQRRERRLSAFDELDEPNGTLQVSVAADDGERNNFQRLLGAEIETALATLSPEARVMILLDVEGFTESEVADVVGCAVGTVKSRLSRARVLLRERLRDYAPPTRRPRNTRTGEK